MSTETHYQKNKQRIIERTKLYYYSHRDHLLQRGKEYYHNNKAKSNAYNKQYYQLHKEELIQKMKDRYLINPRVKLTDDQKKESHQASMRKYSRKVRTLAIKRDKEKVIRTIENIEVEYNAEGLIKLDRAYLLR
jgi:hypothetical protein